MTGNDEMEELEELLAAYVIDALDPGERAAVDHYLDADPQKRDEVRRLTAAFDELVAAQAPTAAPPPELWDRIAARLADEGKVPQGAPSGSSPTPPPATASAATARRAPGGASPGPAPSGPAAPVAPADELGARRARSGRVRRAATAIVLAAAAVALVVVGLALRPKEADTTMTAARVEQEANAAAAAPGSRVGTLTSTDVDLRVVLAANGRMYVVPERMPALDDAHAYQLWALDSGTPVSLGVVRGAAAMDLPAGERPKELAVSREPSTGSPQPTSAPLAAGRLA